MSFSNRQFSARPSTCRRNYRDTCQTVLKELCPSIFQITLHFAHIITRNQYIQYKYLQRHKHDRQFQCINLSSQCEGLHSLQEHFVSFNCLLVPIY